MEQPTALQPIHIPVWAWITAVLAIGVLYSLTLVNGAALAHQAGMMHEFVHDARHLIGVPCH